MPMLACPRCRRLLPVSEEFAGKQAHCPECGPVTPPSAAVETRVADRAVSPPQAPSSVDLATTPPLVPVSPEGTETTPPVESDATTPHCPSPGQLGEDGAHEQVPGYEIIKELGRGGMGVVYQARQTKLNRVVALKMILSGGHAGPAERARFRTEAEAIARLQHPNIVQVHEVGEHEDRPFFSLEFCAGGSLETVLGGTPLPPPRAAKLVETLARAMQAAHDANVIHRDLKPANVLLATDGTPKITDFGLAKKLDDLGQTQTGVIMGTPSYMAPEQAGGKSKDLGPAADIYSLGRFCTSCSRDGRRSGAPTSWRRCSTSSTVSLCLPVGSCPEACRAIWKPSASRP
jgi:serine/threonine protein kinase